MADTEENLSEVLVSGFLGFNRMFWSFCASIRSRFHLLSTLGSRLRASVLVATVANKYRGPSVFIQTEGPRRAAWKQAVCFNDDNSYDEKLQRTALYADVASVEWQ